MDVDKEKICSDYVIDATEYFVYLVLGGGGTGEKFRECDF